MTPEQWQQIKYFRSNEFDSPDVPGSGTNMQFDFVILLDRIRASYGPMHINSGFRTPAHNAKVGGVDSSAHTHGWAADIACRTTADRHRLLAICWANGINRIGIAATYIHIDNDPSLPSHRVWLYND